MTDTDSGGRGQPVVWDAAENEIFAMGGDYRDDITQWCEQVWIASGDSSAPNKSLDLPLFSNLIVTEMIGKFADSSHRITQSSPACRMDKGLLGGLVTVERVERLAEDSVTVVELLEFQLYCVYDLNRDTLIFVDSCYHVANEDRGWYGFMTAHISENGRWFVYDKHGRSYRFNIVNGQIDSATVPGIPVVPVNGNDLIVADRREYYFRLYNDSLRVVGEVESACWQLLSAYKLNATAYVIAYQEYPRWYGEGRDDIMFVSVFDFAGGSHHRLFQMPFGQILSVEMEE